MKITYQVVYEVDIEDEHITSSPEETLGQMMEDDPVSLFDTSVILKHKILKVKKGPDKKDIEEADDDDLTVLDEDELDFEE